VENSFYDREVLEKNLKEQEEEFIWFQYLWSLLLTGDKTQLIRGNKFVNKNYLNEKFTEKYKDNLRVEIIKKIPHVEDSPLFNIRENIYKSTKISIDDLDLDNERILSINVPTGTGKTISVYGAAFKLAERLINEKNINPNIIYTVPFTSVIDQNYNVLEDMLKYNGIDTVSDLILKHHSMTPLNYKDSEEKEYKNYDARFLVENWQSTIITTTFVQLFNTIFKSGINSIMHRFHRLAGSIIILDEIQAIPPRYYQIVEDLFNVLCDKFNCYVITVTATKPLFLQGKDLIEDNEAIFKSMNRIIFENYTDEPISLDDFQEIVKDDIEKNEDKSFLIILNTVNSAKKSFEYLTKVLKTNRKVIYLSTEIIPILRLKIINEIKNNKNEKYILVSTQLIEAGVDLDFDIVYRDIAPMDCINQSAGRANRNGVNGKGIVKIYRLLNANNELFSSSIYSTPLLKATLNILAGRRIIEEKDLWKINYEYFTKLDEVTKNKNNENYKEYCKYIKDFNFQKIRKFELIEKLYNKIDVFIRYDYVVEEQIKIINDGGEYQDVVNAWRVLNKYRISVNRDTVKDMGSEIKGYIFLNKEDYDERLGVRKKSTTFI
jgi:CRISPR-associated endonuclease/helicase Cas3